MSPQDIHVTTIGEALIDLTQTGVDSRGNPIYVANPGGAPANVAVAAARLGARTAFIGCVGADSFGAQLRQVLVQSGVDVRGLSVHPHTPTTLAVVSVDGSGERSFSFYRKPGADICLSPEHVPQALPETTAILHFGSVSLTDEPACSTVMETVRQAAAAGTLITYDPNYRAALWPDEETARERIRMPLEYVDVLKISDEETELLTRERDPAQASRLLMRKGIRLVLVTLGARGVYYRYGYTEGVVEGFGVTVADTNGAGDTFFGAVLAKIGTREGILRRLSERELREILRFANCAAALTTSRPGAIPAMPTKDEVQTMLQEMSE